MAKNYSATPASLQPIELSDEHYAAIGKIVRGFAEIEDIITLLICNFAKISESRAVVMLGQTTLSARLRIARQLAVMREDEALSAFDRAFAHPFKDMLQIRNSLAHGTLLGVDPDGLLTFSTNEMVGLDGDAVVSEAIAWPLGVVLHYGGKMSEYLKFLEVTLQVEQLRQSNGRLEMKAHKRSSSPRTVPSSKSQTPAGSTEIS